jgi:ribosomal protein S18 acetylase RimI-like enzyme
VRGQRLFVRPIDAGDGEAVGAFLQAHGGRLREAKTGLVGKLVGDLVAVVAMDIEPEAIRIEDVVVARELRRKRIGRLMLDETARLAAKLERRLLIVASDASEREFFRRSGFEEEGDGWLVRVVR